MPSWIHLHLGEGVVEDFCIVSTGHISQSTKMPHTTWLFVLNWLSLLCWGIAMEVALSAMQTANNDTCSVFSLVKKLLQILMVLHFCSSYDSTRKMVDCLEQLELSSWIVHHTSYIIMIHQNDGSCIPLCTTPTIVWCGKLHQSCICW
jgi:hypothetical protein